MADVRALTEDAPPPSFSVAPLDCKFVDFQPLTIEDVVSAIKSLPDKQCASTMPTRLLKDCADILAPFFVDIFNESLRTSSLPTVFKAAYITPLIRKADLDVDDVRIYLQFPICRLIQVAGASRFTATFGLHYSGRADACTPVGLPTISLHRDCCS